MEGRFKVTARGAEIGDVISLPATAGDSRSGVATFAGGVLSIFPTLGRRCGSRVSRCNGFLCLGFFNRRLIPHVVHLFRRKAAGRVGGFCNILRSFCTTNSGSAVGAMITILTTTTCGGRAMATGVERALSAGGRFLGSFGVFVPFFTGGGGLLAALIGKSGWL